MGVNKVILMGNVGADPRVRYFAEGQAIADFSLATTERGYTRRDGTQMPERTEWHRIVMNGHDAEVAEKFVRKGMLLYIEGKLRTRKYTDRTNIERFVTEVYVDNFEMLSRVGGHGDQGGAAAQSSEP